MKRNQKTKLIAAFGFLLLVFIAAAGSVVAIPGYSGTDDMNECGSCHTTLGTLTLASNSTSLDATTGEAFVLDIDAGNGAKWITVLSSWADNSEFQVSTRAVEDGSTNDTNAAVGAISAAITFTPLSPGNLTIRVWTAAGGAIATSLDVVVNVTGQPVTTYTPPPDDTSSLLETWRIMMIVLPVSVGVILLVFGFTAFKRRN
ncbi:MAG: hypothetical protein ACFFEF_09200 [Candidatus Thorarchaeota archaeon]